MALFGGFCLVTGLVALFQLPADALAWLLAPLVLGAGVGVAVWKHVERSTGGEMLVATALSSLSIPVALAGEATVGVAYTVFVVFALIFIVATISVRALIGRVTKAGGPPPVLAGVLTVAALASLTVLSMSGRLAPVAAFAATPVCAIALGLTVKPPSPKYLREIGWTLVGATLLTAAVLIVGLR